MFLILLLFSLIAPLIGIVLMEQGFFGLDIGMEGYANGATFAYSIYAIIILTGFYLFRNLSIYKVKPEKSNNNVNSIMITCIAVNLVFLFLMLFAFGGIDVLSGKVGKGQFRTNLGPFGFLPYLIIRYFSPVLLAYTSFFLIKKNTSDFKILFAINFLVTLLIGINFGFKSTSISMIIPAVVILFWKANIWTSIKLGSVAFIFLIGSSILFDKSKIDFSNLDISDTNSGNALTFIIYRLTVIQGNVPWLIWDRYITGSQLPSYWPTLSAAVGDKVLSILGVNVGDINIFAKFHYDVLLTAEATKTFDSRLEGHNVTGTAFSEGIFIGGYYGITIIALIAGFLVAQSHNIIKQSILKFNPTLGSLVSVYFFSFIFQWINGGGITILFHISTIFGMFLAWLMLRLVTRVRITNQQIFFKKLLVK